MGNCPNNREASALTQSIAMSAPSRSGVWVLSICLLAILGPLEVEAAKGSLRAGVLSRGGMRRSKNRGYGHDMDWEQRELGYGSYRRMEGDMPGCDEVCQYNRLLGLDSDDEDQSGQASQSQVTDKVEVSSLPPCVGLCHVERVQEMERDNNLRSLKKASKKCVGLCYILRKKGQMIDPGLKELQERRPCVGLCFLLKKKMDLLEEETSQS